MRQNFVIALLRTALRLLSEESSVQPEPCLATEFMRTRTRKSPGKAILLRDVYAQFLAWLPDKSSDYWSRTRFGRAIRASGFIVRARTGNKVHICDVEWFATKNKK
jgi:hypothetical protein